MIAQGSHRRTNSAVALIRLWLDFGTHHPRRRSSCRHYPRGRPHYADRLHRPCWRYRQLSTNILPRPLNAGRSPFTASFATERSCAGYGQCPRIYAPKATVALQCGSCGMNFYPAGSKNPSGQFTDRRAETSFEDLEWRRDAPAAMGMVARASSPWRVTPRSGPAEVFQTERPRREGFGVPQTRPQVKTHFRI